MTARPKDSETLVAVVGPTMVEQYSNDGWRLIESIPSGGNPYFIMEKGPESALTKLSAEVAAAKADARDASAERWNARNERDEAQKLLGKAEEARDFAQETAKKASRKAGREEKLRRKMEEDLGKIRHELGDKLFRETIEGDKP